LAYVSKHDITEDVDPLLPLLNDPSALTRTETQILDALYNTALLILESTPKLDITQKTRALYFYYNLCTCDACQKECGAHRNKKGQIRISQKFFQNTLKSPPPTGLLELIYTIFHQILHGIFPEHNEATITENAEQAWNRGMLELKKEKLTNE